MYFTSERKNERKDFFSLFNVYLFYKDSKQPSLVVRQSLNYCFSLQNLLPSTTDFLRKCLSTNLSDR